MGRFLLTVAAFLFLVTAVTALKCYVCDGTEDDCKKSTLEGDKDKYLKECPQGKDRCMREFKNDNTAMVKNSCSDAFACSKATIGCGHCEVGCCGDDACNVSTHVSLNVFLLTVCFALGLALLM